MRRKKKQPKRLPKQSENPKKIAPKGSETVPESRKTAQEPQERGPHDESPKKKKAQRGSQEGQAYASGGGALHARSGTTVGKCHLIMFATAPETAFSHRRSRGGALHACSGTTVGKCHPVVFAAAPETAFSHRRFWGGALPACSGVSAHRVSAQRVSAHRVSAHRVSAHGGRPTGYQPIRSRPIGSRHIIRSQPIGSLRALEQNWENAISECLRLHPRRHFPSFVPGVGRYARAREQNWENATS